MILPILFAAMIAVSHPAPAASASAALDQKRIHSNYNDGNFESVVRDIEYFQNTHKSYSESDSIFIAKHLAVVYSANPATREKGKYYMFRLLEMLPSAKLIDMYVSDEIDRIFDKVKEEYMAHQKDFGVDTSKTAMPERAPVNQKQPEALAVKPAETRPVAAKTKAETDKGNTALWIAGGVGVVTVGLAAVYFLASPNSSKENKVYDVP